MGHIKSLNPRVVFIPNYILGICCEQSNLVQLNGAIREPSQVFRDALDLMILETRVDRRDVFNYVVQNQKLMEVATASGGSLFDGFTSVFNGNKWLDEIVEDFQSHLKILQSTQHKEISNPLNFGAAQLIRVSHVYYSFADNILYLVELEEPDVNSSFDLSEEDLDAFYKKFLRCVLEAIGKQTKFEQLMELKIADEWLKSNRDIKSVIEVEKRLFSQLTK